MATLGGLANSGELQAARGHPWLPTLADHADCVVNSSGRAGGCLVQNPSAVPCDTMAPHIVHGNDKLGEAANPSRKAQAAALNLRGRAPFWWDARILILAGAGGFA